MTQKIHGDLEVTGELKASQPAIINVTDASAMQAIISAGTTKVGQLFKLFSDKTLRIQGVGSGSSIVEKYYNQNPPEMVRTVSVKTTGLSCYIKHNGGDSATGICYSVDGGAPVYMAGAADTTLFVALPSNAGAPVVVYLWAATSASSGRKGEITYLVMYHHQLTFLDVSGLTALTRLQCTTNSLTNLDVGGLTALTTLYCDDNNLTNLDVSGLTALTYLNCYSNNLTSLDVSGLTALTALICNSNNLTSLDAGGLTALTQLNASNLGSLTGIAGSDSLIALQNPNFSTASVKLTNSGLTASAIDSFFTDLPVTSVSAGIDVSGSVGAATCTPSIATTKGYSVTT